MLVTSDSMLVTQNKEYPDTPPKVFDSGVLGIVIDGQGVAIATGVKGDLVVPYDCIIQSYTITADVSGSIVVDVWKDSYANFPPTDADKITASAPITISSATKAQNSTLTGWSKTLRKGDILRFNVNSAATITKVTVSLSVKKI